MTPRWPKHIATELFFIRLCFWRLLIYLCLFSNKKRCIKLRLKRRNLSGIWLSILQRIKFGEKILKLNKELFKLNNKIINGASQVQERNRNLSQSTQNITRGRKFRGHLSCNCGRSQAEDAKLNIDADDDDDDDDDDAENSLSFM